MIKIDLKDKKIIFHLLQDSRQSLKTIGKKVGISKELAAYRIKRLFNNKIITNYTIYVNCERLGYVNLYVFYNFAKINPNIKEEIINFFVKSKYTSLVGTIDGIYDLQVDYLVGDPSEYESLMDQIQKKFHKYLKYRFLTVPIKGEDYNYPFLIDETVNITKPWFWSWGNSITSIDELDFKILLKLSEDPSLQTKTIANNLKSTVSVVNYRIKKMIKENIIEKYSINVDWIKLGYRYFHLRISLTDYNKKSLILNYIRKNPYLIRIWNKEIVYSFDIHCTFLLQNMEQLRKLIEDLTLEFPDAIDKCDFYSIYKLHKNFFMVPKLLAKKSPINRGKIY